MSKDYLVPLAIFLGALAVGGAVIFTQVSEGSDIENDAIVAPSEQPAGLEVTEGDHIRGNVDAPVTILEYSEFQCPYCESFHSTVERVLEEYGDQVRWVFRHFPLEMHDQAMPAALASECVFEQAGDEGFWSFSDKLFEKRNELGPNLYEEAASQIGVDMDKFKECIESERYVEQIEAEMNGGKEAGVRGTPGSFVNDVELGGAAPYETLKEAIDSALAQ